MAITRFMVLHTSFLGGLIGRGVTGIARFLGGGSTAAGVVRGVGTIAAGTAAGIGVASLFDGDEEATGTGGESNRTRTIVQTINPAGQVVRQRVLRGTPHLMNRDLMVAKRVFRVSQELHGKLPRRTVKESEVTALKNRIVKNALDKAGAPCPPS